VLLSVACRTGIFFSHFLGNLAWLQLARPETWSASSESDGGRALALFRKAIAADPSNSRAFLGAGIASLLLGDEAEALAAWREGRIAPETLIGLGTKARSSDDALVYYRGADAAAKSEPNPAEYLAGQVCQAAFAQPDALKPSNDQFCRQYFARNGGNLILNGQFAEGNTWGWDGQFFFSDPRLSAYSIDWLAGKPIPSLSIAGFTGDRHHGLYQMLSLSHEATIRYSAWLKAEGAGDMEARLLYIGWRQNDQAQGNQQAIASESMGWTYLERTWQLPAGSDPGIVVYPVLLTGEGTVWADDVRLEVLSSQ